MRIKAVARPAEWENPDNGLPVCKDPEIGAS
jgi:hypothetical protein